MDAPRNEHHGQKGFDTKEESLALEIVTANGTCWSSIQKFLGITSGHVVLCQEHKLITAEEIRKAQAWSVRNGWSAHFEPGLLGPGGGGGGVGGGASAGVAVLARNFLGFHFPDFGPKVVSHRATGALVHIPGQASVYCVSTYLQDCVGLNDTNQDVLATIAARVTSLAVPFVVGADFNFEPALLAGSSLPARMGSQIVYPKAVVGTCRSVAEIKMYDYFLVSSRLAQAIDEVKAVSDSELATHDPVSLTFHPCLASLKALTFRKPPPLSPP